MLAAVCTARRTKRLTHSKLYCELILDSRIPLYALSKFIVAQVLVSVFVRIEHGALDQEFQLRVLDVASDALLKY